MLLVEQWFQFAAPEPLKTTSLNEKESLHSKDVDVASSKDHNNPTTITAVDKNICKK